MVSIQKYHLLGVFAIALLAVVSPVKSVSVANITFSDNGVDPSIWTFSYSKNGLFAFSQGNLKFYQLNSAGTYELSFSIMDNSRITANSSAYIDGNRVLVGMPLNETSFVASLYAISSESVTLEASIQSLGGEECSNVGKSVLLYMNAMELVLGGDSCVLFYYFNETSDAWEQRQNLYFDGGNLAIGNNLNLISGVGAFVGLPEFGMYLVNNLYCRNDNNATWGPCLQRFSAYGFIPSTQYICDNQRVFWLTANDWGTFDLQYIIYGTAYLTVDVTQTDYNIFDYNLGVSDDCNTIAYNHKDPDTGVLSIKILQLNQTSGQFEQIGTNDYARLSSPNMPYTFNSTTLLANVHYVTDQKAYQNLFVWR